MRIYSQLTDEELQTEIGEYVGVLKKLASGGIAVVAGEGRRIEYAPGSEAAARTALRELYTEARLRGLSWADGGGSAIAVEIG